MNSGFGRVHQYHQYPTTRLLFPLPFRKLQSQGIARLGHRVVPTLSQQYRKIARCRQSRRTRLSTPILGIGEEALRRSVHHWHQPLPRPERSKSPTQHLLPCPWHADRPQTTRGRCRYPRRQSSQPHPTTSTSVLTSALRHTPSPQAHCTRSLLTSTLARRLSTAIPAAPRNSGLRNAHSPAGRARCPHPRARRARPRRTSHQRTRSTRTSSQARFPLRRS